MFPSTRTSKLAQRTLATLRLARSLLLLEDDYDVDWEVDRDELGQSVHPHRVALPGRMGEGFLRSRRPGQPSAPQHVCLSPVNAPVPARLGTRPRSERQERSHHDPRATTAAPQSPRNVARDA